MDEIKEKLRLHCILNNGFVFGDSPLKRKPLPKKIRNVKARKIIIYDNCLRITMENGLIRTYQDDACQMQIEAAVVDASNIDLTKDMCLMLKEYVKTTKLVCRLPEEMACKDTFLELLDHWKLKNLFVLEMDPCPTFNYDMSSVEKLEINVALFLDVDAVFSIEAKTEAIVGICHLVERHVIDYLEKLISSDERLIRKTFHTMIKEEELKKELQRLKILDGGCGEGCKQEVNSWVIERNNGQKMRLSINKGFVTIRPVPVL